MKALGCGTSLGPMFLASFLAAMAKALVEKHHADALLGVECGLVPYSMGKVLTWTTVSPIIKLASVAK